YGLHKVAEAKVRQALGVKEGDPLPRSKGDTEGQIDALPGVVESHLEAVCCDGGRMILYVGVEEKGAAHFDLREAPDGDAQLPEEARSAYQRFLEASQTAARKGQTAEDLTHGHALSANPEVREIQEEFIPVAKLYTADLRRVLRESSDDDQRAIAAYLIGYAPDKKAIVDDLQYALKDPDTTVRANAAHGLRALAVFARLNPSSGLKIEPTWFIEMLNSLSWSDRNQAVEMLLNLTDDGNASTLDQIRERGLVSLTEMARWKSMTHALPAFLLLGRVAGLPDLKVHEAWERGDRESVIAQAAGKKKK
ncbi:MAG TPA: HEAT repeat domain-containing protein, partial [Candidatus Binataceae bacterium]